MCRKTEHEFRVLVTQHHDSNSLTAALVLVGQDGRCDYAEVEDYGSWSALSQGLRSWVESEVYLWATGWSHSAITPMGGEVEVHPDQVLLW